jgi:hypothetical protein
MWFDFVTPVVRERIQALYCLLDLLPKFLIYLPASGFSKAKQGARERLELSEESPDGGIVCRGIPQCSKLLIEGGLDRGKCRRLCFP